MKLGVWVVQIVVDEGLVADHQNGEDQIIEGIGDHQGNADFVDDFHLVFLEIQDDDRDDENREEQKGVDRELGVHVEYGLNEQNIARKEGERKKQVETYGHV